MIRPPHALIAAVAAAGTLTLGHAAYAQHSDVDFAFENDRIEVEFGPEGQVFEGEFPTSGSLSEQFTDDPGFAQEDDTPDFPTGTNIDYNILGPLRYHDGTSFAAVTPGVQIQILDNLSGSGPLTVTDATAGPVSGPGVIGDANGGHAHIDFTLQPGEFDTANNPPAGAYGLLMELIAVDDDLNPVPGVDNSDPFYIVFNFGLDPETFEGAVGDFAALIPEPTSLAIAGLGGLVLLGRRRMKRA